MDFSVDPRGIDFSFDPCPSVIEEGFKQMGITVTHASHLSDGWYVMHIEKEGEKCSACIGAVVAGMPMFVSKDMMSDEIDLLLSVFSATVHDLQGQAH